MRGVHRALLVDVPAQVPRGEQVEDVEAQDEQRDADPGVGDGVADARPARGGPPGQLDGAGNDGRRLRARSTARGVGALAARAVLGPARRPGPSRRAGVAVRVVAVVAAPSRMVQPADRGQRGPAGVHPAPGPHGPRRARLLAEQRVEPVPPRVEVDEQHLHQQGQRDGQQRAEGAHDPAPEQQGDERDRHRQARPSHRRSAAGSASARRSSAASRRPRRRSARPSRRPAGRAARAGRRPRTNPMLGT